MNINVILQFATVISGVLTMLLILLQQRGATLGAGFGASGELYTERRGVEKSIFRATIFFAFICVASILTILLLPRWGFLWILKKTQKKLSEFLICLKKIEAKFRKFVQFKL